MILLLIVLFLVLPVAGGLVVLSAARRAPEGFEDGRGFHRIAASREEAALPELGGDAVCGTAASVQPAPTADLELPFGAF